MAVTCKADPSSFEIFEKVIIPEVNVRVETDQRA
jgi:hypothetical protein